MATAQIRENAQSPSPSPTPSNDEEIGQVEAPTPATKSKKGALPKSKQGGKSIPAKGRAPSTRANSDLANQADMMARQTEMLDKLSASMANISSSIKQLSEKHDALEKQVQSKDGTDKGPSQSQKRKRDEISDESEESDLSDGEVIDEEVDVLDSINNFVQDAVPSTSSEKAQDEPDECERWLQEIEQELVNNDKRSNPVSEYLERLLNNILKNKISEEKVKELLDKYPPPANLQGMVTPKVNLEIWNKLKTDTRSRDIRMQKAQQCCRQAVTGV